MTRPSLADITQRAAEYATRIQSFCSPRLRSIAAHESADDVPALSAAIRDVLAVADQLDRLAARHPDSETGHVETAAAHEIRAAITAHIDTTKEN